MNKKKIKKLIIVNNQCYKDKRGYFKEILLEKKIILKKIFSNTWVYSISF